MEFSKFPYSPRMISLSLFLSSHFILLISCILLYCRLFVLSIPIYKPVSLRLRRLVPERSIKITFSLSLSLYLSFQKVMMKFEVPFLLRPSDSMARCKIYFLNIDTTRYSIKTTRVVRGKQTPCFLSFSPIELFSFLAGWNPGGTRVHFLALTSRCQSNCRFPFRAAINSCFSRIRLQIAIPIPIPIPPVDSDVVQKDLRK